MDGARFDSWTRRRFGLAMGGAAASLLGLSAPDAADARKKRKKKNKRCRKVGRSCKRGKECCGSLACALAGEPERRRCCRREDGACAGDGDCCAGLLCFVGTCQLPVSDRALKAGFAPVDGGELLERVRTLPITTWHYTSEQATIRHLGPMAQEFAAAFGVGADDRHIHPIDAQGVALAAIQQLAQQLETVQAQNAALTARLEALERESERG